MVTPTILFFLYPHHFSHKHAFTQVATGVRFDAERIKSTRKTTLKYNIKYKKKRQKLFFYFSLFYNEINSHLSSLHTYSIYHYSFLSWYIRLFWYALLYKPSIRSQKNIYS